jgi:signal transduction histidine kinase
MQSRSAGASRRSRSAVERTVESRLLEERTRWAMHVHDGLTQSVTSAVLELQTLRRRIETDPETAAASIDEIEAAIRNDLTRIREIIFELEGGRVVHEPRLGAFIAELVDRWKLHARISLEGDMEPVSDQVLDTAQGIIAESLANAAKHSGTPDVSIKVRVDTDELHIEIQDRGRGITAVTDDDPHFGLRLLETRTQQLNGSISFESKPGSGTRVIATLPVGGRGDN